MGKTTLNFGTFIITICSLLVYGCSELNVQPEESEDQLESEGLVLEQTSQHNHWEPGDPLVDGTYEFVSYVSWSAGSNKRMGVVNSSTGDLAQIEQRDDQGNARLWKVTDLGGGDYKIINVNSGKALDVLYGLTDPGTLLVQYPYSGGNSQRWKIEYQAFGLYRIKSKMDTSMGAHVENASTTNGARIRLDNFVGSGPMQGAGYFFVSNLDEYFFNPLLTSGPDPWVTEKDGYYYYMHTTGSNITIRKTDKMSELRDAPATVVWTPPSGTSYSHNLWAPELHFLDGNWYVYFAADDGNDQNHRMYVIENTSSDPTTGSWTFKGKISAPSDIWAIDGTVLEEGGDRYFLWSGWRTQDPSESGIQQIYIAEMSNAWTITSSRTLISESDYNWEKHGLVNEGPQILRNSSGDVFVIYSASGCWTDEYKLGQLELTGSDPLQASSWTKKSSPVFEQSPGNSVYGPGHASFFKSPDGTEDWIIYHAQSESDAGCSGSRSPRIQKFTWSSGEPDFGAPKKTSTAITKPSGE